MAHQTSFNQALSLALALSLTGLAGCALAPSLLGSDRGGMGTSSQTSSALAVTLHSESYRLQGTDLSTMRIELKLYLQGEYLDQPRTPTATQGSTWTFENLPPRRGNLKITVRDAQDKIQAEDWAEVDLKPGVTSKLEKELVVGGSAATDLGLGFETGTKSPADFKNVGDGLDGAPWPDRAHGLKGFFLTKNGKTAPVLFNVGQYGGVSRVIDAQPRETVPDQTWGRLPSHAELKPGPTEHLGYSQVRKFAWENTYDEKTFRFERWISATEGLIEEAVHEKVDDLYTEVSRLVRHPALVKGSLLEQGFPAWREVSLRLRVWNGENFDDTPHIGRSIDGKFMFFAHESGNPAPGTYQIACQSLDLSLANLCVFPAGQQTAPDGLSFDIGWHLNPSVYANGSYSIASPRPFTFEPKPGVAPDTEYQLVMTGPNLETVWSSAWSTATSRAWNGMRGVETDEPSEEYLGSGPHRYQIRFRQAGTAYEGSGYYGASHWIPFTVYR